MENVLQDISNLKIMQRLESKKNDLPEDGRDWSIDWARKYLSKKMDFFIDILYYPFDNRKHILQAEVKDLWHTQEVL